MMMTMMMTRWTGARSRPSVQRNYIRIFNELKGWSCMRRSIAVGAFGSLGGRLRFTHFLHNCGGSFFIVKNEFFSEPNVLWLTMIVPEIIAG